MTKKFWLMATLSIMAVGSLTLGIFQLQQTTMDVALPTLMVLPTDIASTTEEEARNDIINLVDEVDVAVIEDTESNEIGDVDVEDVQSDELQDIVIEDTESNEIGDVDVEDVQSDELEYISTVAEDIIEEPVPQQMILNFDPSTSEAERTAYIQQLGGTVTQQVVVLNTVIVTVPESITKKTLPKSSVVQSIEPDFYVVALDDQSVNDPRYSSQWALPIIDAPLAWSQLPSDARQITVAVIDSGICATHSDLEGRIVAGYDFVEDDTVPQDDFGHGCGVSGIIAANTNNAIGIAGVAPNAQIMPLRVLDHQGVGSYSDVAAALVYAADHDADIVNLSLGGLYPSNMLSTAIDYAVSNGVTVIAAAGNTGGNVLYPAAYDSVVAVAAVDANLELSSFSSYGPEIDLLAPGRDILTTTINGNYRAQDGTSFAAPYVSGVAALEMAFDRSLVIDGEVVRFSLDEQPTEEIPVIDETPTPELIQKSGEPVTRVGWLNILHGDSDTQSFNRIILGDKDTGDWVAELDMDLNEARSFSGHLVEAIGTGVGPQNTELTFMEVDSITSVKANQTTDTSALVVGTQPFINILCRFKNDNSTPITRGQVQAMFSNSYPGLNDYWQTVSYGNIDINDTSTINWVTLPHTRSYYQTYLGIDMYALMDDCTAAAESQVNFTQYEGINTFYNSALDGYAMGGERVMFLNGQWKEYSVTWMPPWSQYHAIIAHEMGHSFDFMRHSSGSAENPTNGYVYISQWDIMSAADGTCKIYINGFGCIGTGAIADNLDIAGWMGAGDKLTVSPGQTADVTLQFLSSQSTSNYRMARIPVDGSSIYYYTVEARKQTGYDRNIPGKGVIIHEVLTTRPNALAYVVDAGDNNNNVNDAGARWLVGETYRNNNNHLSIEVLSQTSANMTVRINNNAAPNDDFDNAEPLTLSKQRAFTEYATTAGDDPLIDCGYDGSAQYYHSVWYEYTPTQGGKLKVNTFGSDFDTELAVWTGTRGSLVNQACNDDFNGVQSKIALDVLPGVTYYIEVAAYSSSEHGNLILSSSFKLPSKPKVPALLLPANNELTNDNTPSFDWDDVQFGDTYRIQIDNNKNFGSPVVDSVVSTSDYTSPLLSDRRYFWRVRAQNVNNVKSAWSSIQKLTIDTVPPVAPVLTGPSDGQVTTNDRPKFKWTGSAGVTGYVILVDYVDPPIELLTITPELDYRPLEPMVDGAYFWRVYAIDAAGNASPYSSTFSLVIESKDDEAPIRNRYASHTPTLTWGRLNWATKYQIKIADNPEMAYPKYTLATSDGATLSKVTPYLGNGIWYWKVRARNANNQWGPWSDVDEFAIVVP